MRACVKCAVVKPLVDFTKAPSCVDGHAKTCKACRAAHQKEYNARHPEKKKARGLAYRARPEVAARLSENSARWYQENKERNAERRKRWRLNNPGREAQLAVQRRKTDPAFKIKGLLRSRVFELLKRDGKSASTMGLLGITDDGLRKHIEAQWLDGMSWDNHSLDGWHIDHIRPCSSFDLTDPVQQRACFHYTNLRPLWAKDNLSKGAKWQEVAA